MTAVSNWETKKCLYLSLAILLAMLGLFGLGQLGYDIPILRQVVGFIFLTFLPGFLILRLLRIRDLGMVESLLYSVGLSLAFVMFCGAMINFLLPLLGIAQPISAAPLMVTLSIFMLILVFAAYMRDRDFRVSISMNISELFPPSSLLLILLPVLAVLGGLMVSYYQNNLLSLILILVIAAIVGLAAFGKLIPERSYPLAIVMIAGALLLHITLASPWLGGGDIHVEYYYQNLVLQNGYWDATIPDNVNTTLSIVMLMPIYSLILNIDTVWVFKLIHPLIFSLVPLALFCVYRQQIGDRKAFISTFFFMALLTFFVITTQAARQEIAELFFALLILLFIDRKLATGQKTTLAIVFSLSLVVSHYALGYIGFALLLGSWFICLLMKSKARVIWQWITKCFGGVSQDTITNRALPIGSMALIIGIYLVFALGWYGGIARGTAVQTIGGVAEGQYSFIVPTQPLPSSEFFEPTQRESLILTALGLDFMSASAPGKVWRIFQYITELFIIIGFIRLLLKPKGFKAEYIALSMMSALMLFLCIVLPRFASQWDITRFYHVALFFLAPLFVLGGETVWQGMSRLSRRSSLHISSTNNSRYLGFLTAVIIIPYFLFNAGFIFEVTGSKLGSNLYDQPWTRGLNSRVDTATFNTQEAKAVGWLAERADDKTPVYADVRGFILLREWIHWSRVGIISGPSGGVPDDAYIFLRARNLRDNEIYTNEYRGVQREVFCYSLDNLPELRDRLRNSPLIYNNAGAHIVASR